MKQLPFPQLGPLENECYIDHLVRVATLTIRRSCEQRLPRQFDPWKAARMSGIQVRIVKLPDTCEGMVQIQSDGIYIDLRHGTSHERLRFTLAHELAHLLFVKRGVSRFSREGTPVDPATAARKEETICNLIAAELLMPRSAFSRKARALCQHAHGRPGLDAVATLARDFAVSQLAVKTRLDELRLWRDVPKTSWLVRPLPRQTYELV